MKPFIKILILSNLLIALGMANAVASDYPNYGIWDDQLTPQQAQGRFQWLEKCYDGLLVETWEKMFDVTNSMSSQDKINQLKNFWLYKNGALRTDPQYLTFGDENHENPENWFAGTSANQVCKTIPRAYGTIGLLTSFDFKEYCPISALNSRNISIVNVSLGGYTIASDSREYSNFSGKIIQLDRGQSVTLTAKEAQIHPRLKGTWHIFADWNRNGVLNNSGEIIRSGVIASEDEISVTFTVPENAQPGYTRLRITDDYAGGSSDPCRSIMYGEVEDYTLKIN